MRTALPEGIATGSVASVKPPTNARISWMEPEAPIGIVMAATSEAPARCAADIAGLQQPLPQALVDDQRRGHGSTSSAGFTAATTICRSSSASGHRIGQLADERAQRLVGVAQLAGSPLVNRARRSRTPTDRAGRRQLFVDVTRARPRTTRLKRPSGSSCAITTSPTPAIGCTAGRRPVDRSSIADAG